MSGFLDHNVVALPVEKLDGGVIGYRFVCSCGRQGNGRHRTSEKAVERGYDHIKPSTWTEVDARHNV